MTRRIIYMAHPLGGDVTGNIARALRWLRFLRHAAPDVTFVAPWLASVISGDDDSDPAQRQAGLNDAIALIPRLDGVILVGGRISAGMAIEMAAIEMEDNASAVFDATSLGDEPPMGTNSRNIFLCPCAKDRMGNAELILRWGPA